MLSLNESVFRSEHEHGCGLGVGAHSVIPSQLIREWSECKSGSRREVRSGSELIPIHSLSPSLIDLCCSALNGLTCSPSSPILPPLDCSTVLVHPPPSPQPTVLGDSNFRGTEIRALRIEWYSFHARSFD